MARVGEVLGVESGRPESLRGYLDASWRRGLVSSAAVKNVRALELQLSRWGSARFDFPRPPGREVKTVHSGLLARAAATGCSIVLDLPLE